MSQTALAPAASTQPTIRIESAEARHDRTLALRDITVSIRPGSVTAVVGPNGGGKSTLFALISGRLRPTAGTVRVHGDVAEVLQSTAVDADLRLTVADVVRLGRYPSLGLLRPFRDADRNAVEAAIERVGLTEYRRRPIQELSGGQRQRALIAQGIAQDAPILLLDEPAAGLDLHSQKLILDIVRDEADAGRTVLFSTHQLSEAAVADTVIALACDCVCCAPPALALHDATVTTLFHQPVERGDRPGQFAPDALAN